MVTNMFVTPCHHVSALGFSIILSMVAVGYFCAGGLWVYRKVRFWREEWIKLEHDLAREQQRRPRNIQEFEDSQ